MPKYRVGFSFRIYVGEDAYLGPGRIQLMEGIRAHGSIARAADQMGMSYRKAWQLVKDMNEVSETLLVEKRLGGKKGGGAIVTEYGEKAIEKYYKLRSKAEQFFRKATLDLKF